MTQHAIPIGFPQELREICKTHYFRLNLKVRSEDTKRQYFFAINNLESYIGHPAMIDDLVDDNVTGMMGQLLDRKLAAATVNERRIRINALWNWLAKRGHIRSFPCNYAVTEPETDPSAWTRAEMAAIVNAANTFVEGFDRKHLGNFWHALFSVEWDSGARTTEILSLRWEWLNWDRGVISVPRTVRKGKRKSAIYHLKPATLLRLKNLTPKAVGLIFECDEQAYYYRYRKLMKRAGLTPSRKNGLQKWRRSYATYIELAGGDATKELMHDTRETTIASYLDRSILDKPQNVLLFPLGTVEA